MLLPIPITKPNANSNTYAYSHANPYIYSNRDFSSIMPVWRDIDAY